jgi:membrane protein
MSTPARAEPAGPRRIAQNAFEFALRCARRFVEFEGIDRSVVLASQLFSAGIPLMMVFAALEPRGTRKDFATSVIERFDLHGSGADTVRALFLPSTDVRGALTWISLLLLLFSVSTFTRTVQHLYERAWGLERLGTRGAWRGFVWVLGLGVYLTLISLLKGSVDSGAVRLLLALASIPLAFAFWLWTPRILVGARVGLRRFVPVASLTTIGMTIAALATPVYMPHLVSHNAARFGVIGVAFALLSWLFVIALVAVVGIVLGRQIDIDVGARTKRT